MNDPTGSYAFAYDNMGRLIGTTTTYSFLTTPFTNSYSYDADSNRTGFTAPDSSTNTYTYDTLNRLTTLANSWAGSFGFSYDALSRRTQMTRPNGIATNYAYDKLSHLLSVLHQAGTSTIDGEAYTVDPAGNRTAKTDYLASATSNYTYDKIYELTQVIQGVNTMENYSYDAVGNRLSSLGVSSYTNNTSNELTSTSTASYAYDYNGNTTSKTDSTGTTNYTWDAENRLTSAAGVTYTYDGDGQRVKKSSGTLYWRDANGSVLAETDTSGNTLNEYIFFGGRIARRDSSGNVYYYFANALGSPTVTNSTGGLCYDADFYPFGGELAFTNTCAQSYKFAALEQDSETGDYHTWFRQYSPTEVRWLSPDPLGGDLGDPQSFNRYSYADNNPCNLTDPLGLSTCALNIKLQNKAGDSVDLSSVEAAINAILKASSDGQPNSVTANFVTDGKADYTVNIVSGTPTGRLDGFAGFWFINPKVYASTIASEGWPKLGEENQAVGENVVHELTHRITGVILDQPFKGQQSDPVYMLQENSYAGQFHSLPNPTAVTLTSDQLKAFYKKCLKKQHARGGGGGSSNLPTNTGTETLWSCSTHYYWSGELGPGTSTTCSATWSFGYGFRGFIL